MTLNARLAALFCSGLLVAGLAAAGAQESKPDPKSEPASPAPESQESEEEQLGQVSPHATRAMLNLANTGKPEALYVTPGMMRPYVEKIMAHRAAGKTFTTLEELQKVTGIPTLDLRLALGSFEPQPGDQTTAPAAPTVVTRGKGKAAGKRVQTEGDPGEPASPEQAQAPAADPNADKTEGPIGDVRPGYFGKLPGYENLDSIDPLKKREFLETINREMCSCGCQTETLAFCLVNDPGCPVVKARVKKIYDDIVSKPPR